MTLTIHFAPPFVISVLDVDSIPYHFYTAFYTKCDAIGFPRRLL